MDPLVILSKPFHISKKINYLYLELERYKVMMNSIPQPNYGSIRIDKSPNKETPNQRALEKYYETQDKITAKERELELAIEEVNNYIDSIDNDEYKLMLKYRYIDNMQFSEIAELMLVSYKTIQRWHKKALEIMSVV